MSVACDWTSYRSSVGAAELRFAKCILFSDRHSTQLADRLMRDRSRCTHGRTIAAEVTLGPGDYDIETTAYWSERVYSHVFRLLNEYDVMLDAILLKPNMVG